MKTTRENVKYTKESECDQIEQQREHAMHAKIVMTRYSLKGIFFLYCYISDYGHIKMFNRTREYTSREYTSQQSQAPSNKLTVCIHTKKKNHIALNILKKMKPLHNHFEILIFSFEPTEKKKMFPSPISHTCTRLHS